MPMIWWSGEQGKIHKSYMQYRLTVCGFVGDISDEYPSAERWHDIGVWVESRGGRAKMERRLVTDITILPMLASTAGYTILPDLMVLSPWEVLAAFDYDPIEFKGA